MCGVSKSENPLTSRCLSTVLNTVEVLPKRPLGYHQLINGGDAGCICCFMETLDVTMLSSCILVETRVLRISPIGEVALQKTNFKLHGREDFPKAWKARAKKKKRSIHFATLQAHLIKPRTRFNKQMHFVRCVLRAECSAVHCSLACA